MKAANLRTQKGVIEVEFSTKEELIAEIKITGDFFIYPEEALESLEQALRDTPIKPTSLEKRITKIYEEFSLSTPGITINDWVNVILKAYNT
ncbi:MAG TPA: lipoate protein ligase C-terminal domain-containing protein [Candidatus Bathyarchaeia archaeon]|nr:lipoate protein ligase C-terminal domain-containing protein [Candidatus Bathyarchaeia archaeon]